MTLIQYNFNYFTFTWSTERGTYFKTEKCRIPMVCRCIRKWATHIVWYV